MTGIVSEAKAPFVLEEWSKRILDPDFVPSERYAKLLIAEVPPKKYWDAIVTIYRKKMSGDGEKLKYIIKPLMKALDDNQLAEYLSIISDELKTTQQDPVIKMVLQILPEQLWARINEVARIRIENKLIQSISLGKTSDPKSDKNNLGWLATWGIKFMPYFTLKDELCYEIVKKLEGDEEDQDFVATYFMAYLPHTLVANPVWLMERQRDRYIDAIVKSISRPFVSEFMREQLLRYFYSYPSDWQDLIKDKVKPLESVSSDYYKKLTEIPEEEDFPF